MSDSLCAGKHTECPVGYSEWHAWAEKKSKTHDQKECPECGLFSIWVLKMNRCQCGKFIPNHRNLCGGCVDVMP